jgi:YYY domain-containing protein
MALQIGIWWLVIQAFGLAGLPLARFLFRALPDRGYAFAKPLGLLLTSYLAWLLAMLGLAPFGTGLIIASGLVVTAIGLLAAPRPTTGHRPPTTDKRSGFSVLGSQFSNGWLCQNWKLVLSYEVVFALALIFLALLRSYNPTPWGTERPMDFALFNAIRRSATFPPHDPWLAGYSINYYYFGYMLMAVVALVSGLAPSVAFNLSLALIFALTALGVAGVVFNLIALTPGAGRQLTTTRTHMASLGKLAAMVLAVVAVLYAGNQSGALQIITGTEISVALKGQQLSQAISNGIGPRQPLYLAPPFKANGWDFDGTQVITPADKVKDFNWWWPSRTVWDDYADPEAPGGQPFRRYTITEFPFFSFWLGDMHPHVMALPFGLLALALALQTLARPTAPPFIMGRHGWLELALTGIVLGSLYAINSWDFPTYLLLFLGALLLLYVRLGNPPDWSQEPGARSQETGARSQEPGEGDTEQSVEDRESSKDVQLNAPTNRESAEGGGWRMDDSQRAIPDPRSSILDPRSSPVHPFTRSPLQAVWWRHFASQAFLAVLTSFTMLAPFYMTFHSLVGGKEPLVNIPILATLTRTLGFVTSSRTAIYSFLLIFGLFLVPLVAFVLAQGRRTAQATTGLPTHPFTRWLPWLALAALVLGLLIGFPLLVLLPLAIYAVALAIQHAHQPAAAFVLWAFALICLVCFGTEVVYIRDTFEGASSRMNTIFKFYYQAWLIWGVLAGYALWWLAAWPTTDDRSRGSRIEDRGSQARSTRSSIFDLRSSILIRWPVIGLFIVLLAGALLYPWLTAGQTFREGQRIGLEGQTPRETTAEGAAAIGWLRASVPGNTVVLEAVGGQYNGEGFGGVSAATGLATVLGWPGHEDQWRGGDPAAQAQIGPRQQDVATIYTTADVGQARALLEKYSVDYVYLGSLERATITQAGAPTEALDKFAQLGEPVFQQGDITIYRVIKASTAKT